MTAGIREITAVSLSVSQDTDHGGARYYYRMVCLPGGCEISVTISRLNPAPGERSFRPGVRTQALHKDGPAVTDFLSGLALRHKVFELEGPAGPHVFLHPTSYRFSFTDSEGLSHEFEYGIEAGRHHDDAYRELVEECEQFFEADRVARSLYEDEIRLPEPPGRGNRLRRKFWYLTSLFFNR